MAIKIGKWEIAPQSGDAGTHSIVHKQTSPYTGREKYTKVVRATIVDNESTYVDETLEINAKDHFLNIVGNSYAEVAYNSTELIIPINTNAFKFKIEPEITVVELSSYGGYTASDNVGTFPTYMGLESAFDASIKVTFPINAEAGVLTRVFNIYMWVRTKFVKVGEFRIHQSSSDHDAGFIIAPPVLKTFNGGAASPQTVSITSKVPYTIRRESLGDPTWVSLSRESGEAGTADLTISVYDQKTGAAARDVTLKFISNITNSVLATLNVHQLAGIPYTISWEQETLTFQPDDVHVTKTNKLTANAGWQIEEKV